MKVYEQPQSVYPPKLHNQSKEHYPSIPNSKSFQCRICLQNIEAQQQQTISPCKCSGSVKYVHFECMSSWITKNNNTLQLKIQRNIHYFPCQMCKTKIDVQLRKNIRCTSKDELCLSIKERKKAFFTLFITNLFASALEAFGIYISYKLKVLSQFQQKWFQSILLLISVIILFLIWLMLFYVFLKKFFLKIDFKVIRIGTKIEHKKDDKRQRSQSFANSQVHLSENNRNQQNGVPGVYQITLDDLAPN